MTVDEKAQYLVTKFNTVKDAKIHCKEMVKELKYSPIKCEYYTQVYNKICEIQENVVSK